MTSRAVLRDGSGDFGDVGLAPRRERGSGLRAARMRGTVGGLGGVGGGALDNSMSSPCERSVSFREYRLMGGSGI